MKRIVVLFTLMMLFSFTASAQEFVKNWEKQAETGDIEAQLKLGEWYKWKNKDKKSLKWYRIAADLGNADACYEMAQLCIKGVSNDDPSMWLLRAVENGNDEMKMKVVNNLLSFNQKDKATEVLILMAKKSDDDIKMQVTDTLLSIGEKSKAIMLLKSWAEQSTSFDWTERIIKKLISLGNSELIHLPKIQEMFCLKAKEQFERKEYQNAYTTLSQVVDQSDSPAKKLLSELKAHEQAMKAREQARKDSLARLFDHGARWLGYMHNGVPVSGGDLSIPYQGQTILVKISEFTSRGEPYRGKIYAFDNWFDLNSSGYYSDIVYGDSWSGYQITSYKYGSMNTLIAEILKNVDKLKNAKKYLAEKKTDQKKAQREAEQWKKTHYHQIPKETRCTVCYGSGISHYNNDIPQRCVNCYGRGYTMEHYY